MKCSEGMIKKIILISHTRHEIKKIYEGGKKTHDLSARKKIIKVPWDDVKKS
jgi:hypothetical protein